MLTNRDSTMITIYADHPEIQFDERAHTYTATLMLFSSLFYVGNGSTLREARTNAERALLRELGREYRISYD